MADFPAGIRCSGMVYLAGSFAASEYTTQAGNLLSFQRSNRETGGRLRIAFRGISRADAQSIRSHYQAESTARSWLLSVVLLDGAEYASEISSMRWRYAGPPQFLDITDDAHNVDLELEHVPAVVWIDRIIATARPAVVAAGATATLIGPDVPPALWVSRLATAGSTGGQGSATGNISIGPDGVSFQSFWFYASGSSTPRVVVVKRNRLGAVLWQRWSGPFGDSVTARDSAFPSVLALSDGGCVLAAQDLNFIASTGTPTARTLRVWRLQDDGDTEWSKDLSVACTGPKQLAVNGEDLLIGTEGVHKDVAPTSGFNVTGPAIIRMSLGTGDLTNARAYKVDSDNDSAYNFRQMLPKNNGRILIAVTRVNGRTTAPTQYLAEVSADLATTHVCNGYSIASVDRGFTRCMATLPDGGLLMVGDNDSNSDTGFLRLSSSYEVLNHYVPNQDNGGSSGGGDYTELFPMALAVDSTGNGCFLRETFASNYLSAGTGVGALRFGDNGSGLTSWSEVANGTGIGDILQMPAANPQMLDLAEGRGVAHIAGSNFNATCRVTAIGFNLLQPTSTAAYGTAAATLDTGSCSNTMSVRGWEPAPGSVTTGATVVKTTSAAPSGAITCTAASASISLSDASGNLTWERKALTA